jgi:hypothetical protein
MKKQLMIVLVLAAVLAAGCGPAAPLTPSVDALGTAVAQTLQAIPTPTAQAANTISPPATPAAGGVPVSGEGVSLVIPAGVATGAKIEAIPEASGADLPTWGIHPAHVQITLEGYPLQGTLLQPQIFVFPVAEFAKLADVAAQASAALKAVLGRQGALPPGPLPFLPVLNAAQVFSSKPLVLPFESGTGIRFLTQFDQAPLPINNNELIYTYQGLTADGQHYVAAILPVNVDFLPADARQQSTTPPNGIPFDWNNIEAMPAYLQAIQQKLEGTDPDAFLPTISSLDTLVQSLRVEIP